MPSAVRHAAQRRSVARASAQSDESRESEDLREQSNSLEQTEASREQAEERLVAHDQFLEDVPADAFDATPDEIRDRNTGKEIPDITEMPVISSMPAFSAGAASIPPLPAAASPSPASPAVAEPSASPASSAAEQGPNAAQDSQEDRQEDDQIFAAPDSFPAGVTSVPAYPHGRPDLSAQPAREFAALAPSNNLSRLPSVTAVFAPVITGTNPTGAAAASAPPKVPLAPLKRVQGKFNPLADLPVYLVVFLGGFVGTALRYLLWLAMPAPASSRGLLIAFHPATFIANMIATFGFAMLSSYISQAIWIRRRSRQLISRGVGMGLCGGFSTLSAMMVEDITAMHNSSIGGLLLYTLMTFICGLAVAWLGSALGLRLTARRAAQAITEIDIDNAPKPAIGVRVPADPAVAGHSAAESAQHAVAADPGAPATDVTDASGQLSALPAGAGTGAVPGEPDPTTDEIPLVADPLTGEVH